MTILILSDSDDDHARHMLRHLESRGADCAILDSLEFPARTRISFDPTGETGTIVLPEREPIPLNEIRSVYWRRYGDVGSPPLPDEEQAFIAYNDARSLFESLLISLPARWVNSWNAYQLHQTKPVQLAMVAAIGIPIPATLLSNDPQQVRDFATTDRRWIYKPVQGGAHTRRLRPEQLTDDHLRHLELAPITLQEEVPGTNIRAFVAGERVLACEIRSEAVDFRDDPDPRITIHKLPAETERNCRRIAETLGLVWTGIDLRRTPEGRYLFLEANPSPMFLGFEEATGLPLTAALGNLLLGED